MAVLLAFILLGHWLKMRARAGASSAIRALRDLTPTKASAIRNGVESQVPKAEVLADEIVLIRKSKWCHEFSAMQVRCRTDGTFYPSLLIQ